MRREERVKREGRGWGMRRGGKREGEGRGWNGGEKEEGQGTGRRERKWE